MTVLPQIAGFAGLDPANHTWLAEMERIRIPNKNAAWAAEVALE